MTKAKSKEKLPGTYQRFAAKFPDLTGAHDQVARAVERVGPLDRKQRELIKIGICVGAGLDSALRSHVRRAVQQGASVEEIDQAILLAMNTVGFPRMVAAWSWAHAQLERDVSEAACCAGA